MGETVDGLTETHNPFDGALAIDQSNYCRFDGKHLVHRSARDVQPSSLTTFVHDGFRALILNEHFTCVGAKAAVRQDEYRFGLYHEMGSAASSAGLARDLFTFMTERESFDGQFSTFVASFEGPICADEASFERLLWRTLQHLHDLDARHHAWSRAVAADASDPRFSFSFAETALFVIGLHAASSRTTRRFAWPTLIFNPHEQFERLRREGQYQRFQQVIREAEQSLQGSVNPMLADFGDRSEAAQYSGRHVGSDWRCPFHARGRAVHGDVPSNVEGRMSATLHHGSPGIESEGERMGRKRIEPQTGRAFELARGDYLRVIDPYGEQVADLIAFARHDPREWLSSGRTLDYNDTIFLTVGNILYSNRSNPLLTITGDTVGRHDFLYTPCSPDTFTMIYKQQGHHPSCFENLTTSLRPFGIDPDRIPTTFNIFMNVDVSTTGALRVLPPRSRAGDRIEFRAETDLIIGLTACSAEMSNNYSFKPIDFEIQRRGTER